MRNLISLRLSSVSEEIAATSEALDRARQRLADRREALDDCRLRMLIAETPVADLDLLLAVEEHRRLEKEVARLNRVLAELRSEEGALSGRLERAPSRREA